MPTRIVPAPPPDRPRAAARLAPALLALLLLASNAAGALPRAGGVAGLAAGPSQERRASASRGQELQEARRLDSEARTLRRGSYAAGTEAAYLEMLARAAELHLRALAIREKVMGADDPSVVESLKLLAELREDEGNHAEVERLYRRALAIQEKAYGADSPPVAQALESLADLYDNKGDYPQAEALYLRAGVIHQSVRNYFRAQSSFGAVERSSGKNVTMTCQGSTYDRGIVYGEPAYAAAPLAPPEWILRRRQPDRAKKYDAGLELNEEGIDLFAQGKYDQAVRAFGQALDAHRRTQFVSAENTALNNLASAYSAMGRYDEAIAAYEKSLAFFARQKNTPKQAAVLHNIGFVYNALSRPEKALEYFERAAALARLTEDETSEDAALNCTGLAYDSLGQYEKAVATYAEIIRLRGYDAPPSYYERRDAAVFNNLGLAYFNLRRYDEALKQFERAREVQVKKKDRAGEGVTLNNLGSVYRALGQDERAADHFGHALAIHRETKNLPHLGNTFHNLMLLWEARGNPSLAAFYGKQAVNTYQEIRSRAQDFEKETQRAFLRSRSQTYRVLAELLISEGRLPEAQQVLALLKQEEYFEFTRRDGQTASTLAGRADLRSEEADADRRLRDIGDRLIEISKERDELLRRVYYLTPAEQRRLEQLEADLRLAQQAFQQFLERLAGEFGKSEMARERMYRIKESQALMEDLRELGAGTVALYTLVGERKYRTILVTPAVQKAFEYPISSAVLNRKVLAFREALTDPRRDPLPPAQELYRVLLGPLAKDLKEAGAETLMWSLDGVLRYVPVAALHDGERYMVERYRNVVFTPASEARLKDAPSAAWTGLGFGVSKAHGNFSPLPAVPVELRGIIREDGAGGAGVLPGKIMLDEAFTFAAMRAALSQRYPVVHIATHFQFAPGNETNSFLLLGDGRRLSLAEIKTSVNLFSGVELLALSACDTAMGGAGADGKEVECFGVLAQRQGAKAVVAALWPVADDSTRLLMQNFYRARGGRAGISKAEALRQSQLNLLRRAAGTAPGAESHGITSGVPVAGGAARYAHPYFWAPFILIGNWK